MFELQEYKKDIVDVASAWVGLKSPFASAGLMILKLFFDLPSKILMHKLCAILSKQESDFDKWLKKAENFEKDSEKYNKTVRQLILTINAINEEPLFDVYANLLRSWQLGFIDKQKFLRLSWALPNIYSEDLFHLKSIYTERDLSANKMLIALHNLGFVNGITKTYAGACPTIYTINDFGFDMLQYGVDFENFEVYKHYRKEKQTGEKNETEI